VKNQLYPMGVTLISLAVMLVLHFLLPLGTLIPSPWNLLGLVPLVCGIAVNLAADRAFHEAGTTVKPFEVSAVLVTGGAYRISRNPMYLGFALILIGVALLLGTPAPWAVVPAFVLLVDRIYIAVEERMLEARFGAEWHTYQTAVRRWI
jgi:protein-S-isoprenylcysteine O-methyltransferase Ste14